jgi:hypothetical protein
MSNTMDWIEDHMQPFRTPDGNCLHCGGPVARHSPVGPIRAVISAPDDEARVHEFCEWRCFGSWAAEEARGTFVVDPN